MALGRDRAARAAERSPRPRTETTTGSRTAGRSATTSRCKVKQARRDQDRDHLRNLGEFRQGTSPRDADSDDDGLRDGKEHGVGDDPTDEDSDGDGVEDGDENAGTIASFDGTTLTINLAAGGSVSGQVTERTEIKCRVKDDDPDPQPTRKRSGSGHEGGDDDRRGRVRRRRRRQRP